MATDENNHKNEARDDWTGCTFRVERGPSSEGRAWGMADILTDVPRRVWPACPVPLTVRGTQALVSFAPLAFKLFCAARQNAVLRRSSF